MLASNDKPPATPSRPTDGPCCPTRAFISSIPNDLTTWAKAAAATQRTPYPMSERDLARKARDSGLATYRRPGVRAELVSLTAVLEFHRDIHRGWHPEIPPPRKRRS
ncbi:hypothetical protein [Streptomyces cavernae]|uniref:hypothetical protein n=1 Tax=Streptomyces cavernae TaxID=2259034 RepID=UPI000FEBFF1C|nr:hypothetical protein [Streptomyces cavernae]